MKWNVLSPILWLIALFQLLVNENLSWLKNLVVADEVPVTHENFRQWVIEDKFCNGRPNLEKVGVTFTNEVHPYESMKLRILNGGHQIVATPGELLSLNTVSQCMQSPLIRDFFCKIAVEDIAPLVESVENISPSEYIKVVERRFANPEIADTVQRITCDGSSRHTGFLIPIIQDAVNSNRIIRWFGTN